VCDGYTGELTFPILNELIKMPFGRPTYVGARHYMADWAQIPHWKGQVSMGVMTEKTVMRHFAKLLWTLVYPGHFSRMYSPTFSKYLYRMCAFSNDY